MFLSKRKTGIYYVYYEVNGARKAMSTKTKKKSEAFKFLTNINSEIQKREQLNYIPITVKKLCWEFLKHSEIIHTEKTNQTYKTTFKFFQMYNKTEMLIDVQRKEIESYIEYRMVNPSVYQARKDYITLASAFNWGISQGYLLDNPCNGIKKPKPPEKLPVFYTKEELSKLLEHIPNYELRELVILAVNTGLRQMELLQLTWRQINLNERLIILDNRSHITKSKKIRSIPLNKKVYDLLSNKWKTENPCLDSYVFIFPGINNRWRFVQNNVRKNIAKAGLSKKLNFHSLRHTFASWLVQKGISIYQVSNLLGHSDVKMTQIYSHLNTESLSSAVEVLSDEI